MQMDFRKALQKEYALVIILVIIGLASFLPNLAGHDLWEPDELRCAEVAREMIADGNWVVPHLEGVVYPDKPPLYFWLMAISSYCFGGLNTFSVRLPSALAGIGGMLIIFFFGKKLGSKRAGFFAALILVAMPCYFAMSISARMDILLTFFVSSALYCFYLAYTGCSSRYCILFFFLMGLGTLTKGPVGFLIPFLTVLSYLLVKREWKKILELRLVTGFLVYAATVVSWVVPAIIIGGKGYAYQILFNQNVGRYVGGWDHQKPFTYYFMVLPIIILPWTPLLPAVFITAIKKRLVEDGQRFILPIMWLATTFVFFSCSGSRGKIYLLPVLPAVSLATAFMLEAFFASDGFAPVKKLSKIYSIVMQGVLIAAAIAALPIIRNSKPSLFAVSLPALGILCAGSIACLTLTVCRAYKTSLIAFAGMIIVVSFTFYFQVMPVVSQGKSVRTLFAEISRVTKPEDDLRTYLIPRVGYSYYWGDVLKRISSEEELHSYLYGSEGTFCLMKQRHYEKIKQSPASPITVVLKMRAAGIRFVLVTAGASLNQRGSASIKAEGAATSHS